jgi:tripartite-type tricarboxylate transporter receptor subunit TctC
MAPGPAPFAGETEVRDDKPPASTKRGAEMKATWRAAVLAAVVSVTIVGVVQAQPAAKVPAVAKAGDFPTRPLRFVIGLAPGGATDIIGRMIAKSLGEELGQSVIVDNRAGAAGSIAGGIVAKALPDGYTMLLVSSSFAINPSLYDLPFDSIKDFSPVAQIAQAPFLLVVNMSVPVTSVKELIARAKANPHTQK